MRSRDYSTLSSGDKQRASSSNPEGRCGEPRALHALDSTGAIIVGLPVEHTSPISLQAPCRRNRGLESRPRLPHPWARDLIKLPVAEVASVLPLEDKGSVDVASIGPWSNRVTPMLFLPRYGNRHEGRQMDLTHHRRECNLTRVMHEPPAATTDLAVLPRVLGSRTLRRTEQLRLRSESLRLPGGTTISTIPLRRLVHHAG